MTELTSGPLLSFLKALELSADHVVEMPQALSISVPVQAEAAMQLDYGVVEQLVGAYAHAIKATIVLDQLTELTIAPCVTSQELDRAKANVIVDAPYRLRLRIDKRMLLDEVLGVEGAQGNVLYFFATSVQHLLGQGLEHFEQAIWAGAIAPRRLLVGDIDLQRSGPVFQIVGGSNLADTLPPLATLPGSVVASIRRMRTDRVEQISWDHQWVAGLTPVQLQLDGEPGGARLEDLLGTAYIQLCILYTCDRARRRPYSSGGWEIQAEYRGGQFSVRVPLREAQPIGTQITAGTLCGFAGLVDWCYRLRDEGATSDWAADRLQFTQVRIATLLRPEPEAVRLTTFVRQVPDVLEALDDQWRSFIDDRIGQYLDKERQLEGVVNDVVNIFAERAAALTKGLSDTLLAAVAVLIGSAIAAAFRSPFNAGLFRVGVLAYAGYVLVFPGLYGLGSQVGQFLDTSKTFKRERDHFHNLIGSRKTDSIVDGRVTKAKTRYRRWFVLTVAGYVLAIVAAILAATRVPAIVT